MLNYTTEDLIQYLYQETTEEETNAIEKAIKSDWNLREKYDALKASMQQLDTLVESPRPQSVMAILNYAKTSAEVEQP
jgi:hypothetical protein